MNDADQNLACASKDTLWVKVTNTTTNEVEYVQLTETGNTTGIFRGSLSTVNNATKGTDANGSLNAANSQALKVEYVDPHTLGIASPSTAQQYDSNNWSGRDRQPDQLGSYAGDLPERQPKQQDRNRRAVDASTDRWPGPVLP